MLVSKEKNRFKPPSSALLPLGEGAFPSPDLMQGFCRAHGFTPRETQILCHICSGMKNTQIGRELGVSIAAIRLHIGNIHRKLQTHSKVDVVLRLWQWSCTSGNPCAELQAVPQKRRVSGTE